ncbi:hypothetical protein B0T17DRAFT_540796 [Bombardia bombarda]|uniref:DNA/RNA-binding protein Alba-like domain-containing protein n=1 Tax=Bombardia bombarda TaxID=252184 RepID=A0AA39WGK2_9PEZI|nr:hypothetical protein B0T17DRAFT_540796 [Bombardia bombarda]
MTTPGQMRLHAQNPAKRKLPTENHDDPTAKKQRVVANISGGSGSNGSTTTTTTTTTNAPSPYLQLHEPLLARLSPKYNVKAMSVMPSTSISKHVDKALQHLGRFSVWDRSVAPGVVLLSAKAGASTKLITISELIRRRIGESEQKWYQYNVLSETESAVPLPTPTQQQQLQLQLQQADEQSVVEDTFMAVDGGAKSASAIAETEHGGSNTNDKNNSHADDYFETSNLMTIHDRALEPPRVRHTTYMSVLVSRVPLDELRSLRNIGLQTNEHQIESLRKKMMGVLG